MNKRAFRRPLLPAALAALLLVAACSQEHPAPPTPERRIEMIKGEALREMQKQADGGDLKAQMVLGNLYYRGEEIKQDLPLAVEWFYKAASKGHAEAQYALGMLYYRGQGVERDPRRAAGWLKKAGAQGHVRAALLLAHIYYAGETGHRELEGAKEWYQKAADAGDPDAQHFLARMYEKGEGVRQSPSAAAYWYYHAGMAWLKEGRRDDALANLDAIKRLDPANEYLNPLNNAIHATPMVEKKQGA